MIKVGNLRSDKMTVISGVHQGSILGRLLFLLYINDIALYATNGDIDLYADESTIYESDFEIEIVNVQKRLQEDLTSIEKWCVSNNMLLHPSKTKCMILSIKQKQNKCNPLKLSLNGSFIENVEV